ncbi:hypothetical protein CDD82_4249 [Ophiocordyceps australis]|uniref:Uncharacterized protein n=1 Tax=Ophiocordyceps australis TaxID=1399860 RepID=A0A2C5ZSG3_9HYPO|nr:hypothetical protein CDD82_4249 [Ophiocordyceps australis]
MPDTLELVSAFGTDIYGLERLLRLVQSLTLLLACSPIAPNALVLPMSSLPQLLSHLNLTRRTMRLFWFLGSFQDSYRVYTTTDGAWLDALASSAFGLFGALESLTLLDLAEVPGMQLLGLSLAERLDAQAQALWLVALCASISGNVSRIKASRTGRGGPGTKDAEAEDDGADKESRTEDEDQSVAGAEQSVVHPEAMVHQRKQLVVKTLADALDLVIPLTSLGWIQMHTGLVALAMLCSTVLSVTVIWNRCRQQLQATS